MGGGFQSAAGGGGALLGGVEGRGRVAFTRDTEALLLRGITAVFDRWTALTMAVANEWGGHESAQKAARLREDTLAFLVMKESKKTSDDSIEEFLRDCMAEDFNVQLEDESHEEVGKVLREMRGMREGESMLVERIEKQKLPKEAMQLRDAIKEADMRNEGWKMAGVDEEMEDGDESESSSGEEMDDEDGDAEELAAGLRKEWGRRRMSLMQMVGRRCENSWERHLPF